MTRRSRRSSSTTIPACASRGSATSTSRRRSTRKGRAGFSLGQFVLHMTSAALAARDVLRRDQLHARGPTPGTGTPPATGFNAEVERMILRFDQSDRLKVSFGRYHTPINYWNTAFHHGPVAADDDQPAGDDPVRRPVPAGAFRRRAGRRRGAGRRLEPQLQGRRRQRPRRRSSAARGDAGDSNGNRAWLANVFVEAGPLLRPRSSAAPSTATRSRSPARGEFGERIVAGARRVAEGDAGDHRRVRGGPARADGHRASVTWSHAYYVQVAYRLPSARSDVEAVLPLRAHRRQSDDGRRVPAACRTSTDRRSACATTRRRSRRIKGEYRTWTRGPAAAAQLRRLLSSVLHVLRADAMRARSIDAASLLAAAACAACSRPSAPAGVAAAQPARTSPWSCIRTCRWTT